MINDKERRSVKKRPMWFLLLLQSDCVYGNFYSGIWQQNTFLESLWSYEQDGILFHFIEVHWCLDPYTCTCRPFFQFSMAAICIRKKRQSLNFYLVGYKVSKSDCNSLKYIVPPYTKGHVLFKQVESRDEDLALQESRNVIHNLSSNSTWSHNPATGRMSFLEWIIDD